MPGFFSTREVADFLGVQTWQVCRLFEEGTLPEPFRCAGKRAIPSQKLPEIIDAMRRRGWLSETTGAAR
jgi:hypothetical protein